MMNSTSKSKSIKILILLTCIVVLFISAIALAVFFCSSNQRLKRTLSAGDKYLSEENFEDALLKFEKAMEIDPSCSDAYLGLIDAYAGLEEYEMAVKVIDYSLHKVDDSESLLAAREQIMAKVNSKGNDTIQNDSTDKHEILKDEKNNGESVEGNLEFEPSEEVINSSFEDGIVQIYDMIFYEYGMTFLEVKEIVSNSDLERDLTWEKNDFTVEKTDRVHLAYKGENILTFAVSNYVNWGTPIDSDKCIVTEVDDYFADRSQVWYAKGIRGDGKSVDPDSIETVFQGFTKATEGRWGDKSFPWINDYIYSEDFNETGFSRYIFTVPTKYGTIEKDNKFLVILDYHVVLDKTHEITEIHCSPGDMRIEMIPEQYGVDESKLEYFYYSID